MATPLARRLKQGLDEARILVLGAQLLLGFQFRAFLQPGFDRLPMAAQYAEVGGLALLLLVLALVISPAPFHRIAEAGATTRRMNEMVSVVMNVTLVPFALVLGVDVFVAVVRIGGIVAAAAVGIATLGAALMLWYGLGLIARGLGSGNRIGNAERDTEDAMAEAQGTPIETRVEHVLTEARVVLPGVQALLGFQLAGVLTDAFDDLPLSSQVLHFVSLGALALAAMLLIAPAAYHRLVEAGEDTEQFHRVASAFVISAVAPLALGIALDIVIVVRKLTELLPMAVGAGLVAASLFATAWYLVPAWARRHRRMAAGRKWPQAA